MSSSGHIFDMINRLRFNLEQKNARRAKREKYRALFFKQPENGINQKVTFSDLEVQQCIAKNREAIKYEKRKSRIIHSIIFILVFVLIVIYFLLIMFKSFIAQ